MCVSLCPPSLSLSIQTHVNCTSLLVEKQTAVLLAVALGNNVAEICGNHQVGTAERECHLNLQVDPTNQDHALRGGKWTVSSQRSGHIMMGKDREDAKTMHSLIHTAGNPEQMPVVGWQQQERKEFDQDSLSCWFQLLPGFSCFQALYATEDSAEFAPTLSLEQLQMKMVCFGEIRKVLFNWLITKHVVYKLSAETLHSSFQLFDRCMQVQSSVHLENLPLLSATCLWITSKFCKDAGNRRMSVADMMDICGPNSDEKVIKSMEIHILTITGGRIHSPTPSAFIQGLSLLLQLPLAVEVMAFYMCDLFIIETDAIGIKPSSIAGACLIVAIHYIGDAVHADGGTKFPNPQEMAIVTRTLISEMCTMAYKVQSLYLLDIWINGLSKDDKSVVPPPPHPVLSGYTSTRKDIISHTLRAVFEHHSNRALILSTQTLTSTPAALTMPRQALLEMHRNLRCVVCGEDACARETNHKIGTVFVNSQLCSPPCGA